MRSGARLVLACTVFTSLALSLGGCASSSPRETTTLSIALSDHEDVFTMSVSSTSARRFFEKAIGSELRCDTDLEPETRHMLEHLRRGGRRYRLESGDTVVVARRRGDRLRLDIRPEDGNRVEMVLPWAAAECLLGRSTDVSDLVEPDLRVQLVVHGEDGTFDLAVQ